jgi:hypothetical protein
MTCSGAAAVTAERGKPGISDYDAAFKLMKLPLSAREGELVLLYIPARKDGQKTPPKSRKTTGR